MWMPEMEKIEVFPDGVKLYPPPHELPSLQNVPQNDDDKKQMISDLEFEGKMFERLFVQNMTLPYPWESEPVMVSDHVSFVLGHKSSSSKR